MRGAVQVGKYDAIIVGGGINGLACAAYLAKAGKKALVLEANPQAGGFCITEQISNAPPGYLMQTYAFEFPFVNIRPSVIEELDLQKYGLKVFDPDTHNGYADPNGATWSMHSSLDKTCASIARLSKRDAEYYRRWMGGIMDVLYAAMPYLTDHPTRPSLSTILTIAGRLAKKRKNLLYGIRVLTCPPSDIIEGFERDELKAYFALNVITGSWRPVDEPLNTSVYGFFALTHMYGLRRVIGGAGQFTAALAACLKAHGGEVRTSCPVSRIVVRNGRAIGIALQSGEEVSASQIVAAVDPTTLFTKLIDSADVPSEIQEEVRRMQVGGGGAAIYKAGIAIDRPPKFLPRYEVTYGMLGGLSFASSVESVNRTWRALTQGEIEDDFPFYIAIPSVVDRSLVPENSKGESIFLYMGAAPYELSGGRDWADFRNVYLDKVIDRLEAMAPGFKDSVVGADITTPSEMNNAWVYKGSGRGVDLIPSQMALWRPSPSLSGYATPGIDNLWRSGHATHPMSGTNCWPGRLTARTMLKKVRNW